MGGGGYFTEMCSGSEVGSYLRLIDFVCHSTLGLRVIKKKKKYRDTSLIRYTPLIGPYRGTMPGSLWWA